MTTAEKAPAGVNIDNYAENVLEVENLKVYYDTDAGQVKAVDDVSFTLKRGERMGLVGESGSGKTTMAMALMRLHKPPAIIAGGTVRLDGVSILELSDEEMRQTRLRDIALVPQGAMNSLNPVYRVRDQIVDGIKHHTSKGEMLNKGAVRERVVELLNSVGLDASVADMYPHELSGGMKQRVALAIATSLRPKMILADEPTSALDVVVQRQIMLTLDQLQQEMEASVLLVGHDMGLMAQFADVLGVMYAGHLVEFAPIAEIFQDPKHPYTKKLISSLPDIQVADSTRDAPYYNNDEDFRGEFTEVRGRLNTDLCTAVDPPLNEIEPRRWVACHMYEGGV
ncbi:Putative peptide import ATP-binding protein BRA1094/BS1330_II1086 [Geodia barretti]|uniref:Peptide import ATP-binding protein BRA1094/BS1330_II1086 n=1 Tax=Geodia barretti TaxID=519541 RepID=A0AA35W836_GEOBA|nr:Putative peptide import ATP-binding protein BRA1094/BS1330_II1086 [Geodia barretti]